MRRFVLSLAVLALVFGVAAQAHASLVGDEILIQFVFSPNPLFFGPAETPTVAEGPDPAEFEFSKLLDPAKGTTIFADVDASTISITFEGISDRASFSAAPFNGLVLDDLDWFGMPDGEIIGFTLATNDFKKLDLSAADPIISSDAHSIAINFANLSISNDSTVDITLLTEGHSAPIPEPGTLFLIGSGLVGLGVGARRRNHRK